MATPQVPIGSGFLRRRRLWDSPWVRPDRKIAIVTEGGALVRKKLCLLIAPIPASYGQRENSQLWDSHMERAADDIRAWGDHKWFIQRLFVEQRSNEYPLNLYVEMVANENFAREAIETLADIVSKRSLNIYAHVAAAEYNPAMLRPMYFTAV